MYGDTQGAPWLWKLLCVWCYQLIHVQIVCFIMGCNYHLVGIAHDTGITLLAPAKHLICPHNLLDLPKGHELRGVQSGMMTWGKEELVAEDQPYTKMRR